MGGVLAFSPPRQPPYRMVWSGRALSARDGMPRARQEQLLQAVEILALDPRPRHALPAEDRGPRRWTVELLPGLQAEYSIADGQRFVMLFGFEKTG